MLGLSLGQSAVYSVLRIIERLTREPLASRLDPQPLRDAGPAVARPDLPAGRHRLRPGAGAARPLPAAAGATARPAAPIGLDLRRPGFDLGFGALVALGIGVPGLGLYLGARALGLNTEVQASGLADSWWTVPVLVLSALAERRCWRRWS